MSKVKYYPVKTSIGVAGVLARRDPSIGKKSHSGVRIVRVLLPLDKSDNLEAVQKVHLKEAKAVVPEVEPASQEEVTEVVDLFESVLFPKGEIKPRLDILDLDSLTPFARTCYESLSRVCPKGRVMSYGALARHIKGGARPVGTAMRRNPFPLIVPCHRVVGADAAVGGWAGGTRECRMKRVLLEMEGVPIDQKRNTVSREAFCNPEEMEKP